jgi:hypothetical protein
MIFKAHHLSVGNSVQAGLITVTITNLSDSPLDQVVIYPIFPEIRLFTSIPSMHLNSFEMQTYAFVYSASTLITGKIYMFYSQMEEKDGVFIFESETMTLLPSKISEMAKLDQFEYLLSLMKEISIDLASPTSNSSPRVTLLLNRSGMKFASLDHPTITAWICFDPVVIIQQASPTTLSLHSFDQEILHRLKTQIEAQLPQDNIQKLQLAFKLGKLLTTLDDLFAIDCETDETIKILNKIRQLCHQLNIPFQFTPILAQIHHTKTLSDLPMTEKNSCVTMIDQFMLEMEPQ